MKIIKLAQGCRSTAPILKSLDHQLSNKPLECPVSFFPPLRFSAYQLHVEEKTRHNQRKLRPITRVLSCLFIVSASVVLRLWPQVFLTSIMLGSFNLSATRFEVLTHCLSSIILYRVYCANGASCKTVFRMAILSWQTRHSCRDTGEGIHLSI